MDILWTEKYKPQKSDEILGNNKIIELMEIWLNKLKKKKDVCNYIFLAGSSGVGKTLTATLVLQEYNYDIHEFNSSNHEKINDFRNTIDSLSKNVNVLQLMQNKIQKPAIIIDEVGNSYKNKVFDIINKMKKNKKKIPIIIICDLSLEKKFKPLIKNNNFFVFKKPTRKYLNQISNRIIKNENLNIDKNILNNIYDYVSYDYRKLIITLDDLKYNGYIDNDVFQEYQKNNIKKKNETTLFDTVSNLLYYKTNIDECHLLYEYDKYLIPMMIYENYENYLINNNNLEEKKQLEYMEKISESFCDGDYIEKNIYVNQYWELDVIHSAYTVAIPNYLIHKYNFYKKKCEINFTCLLSKLSSKKFNYNFLNGIKDNINLSFNNIYLFRNYLLNEIFNYTDIAKNYINDNNITIQTIEYLCKIIKNSNDIYRKSLTPKNRKILIKFYNLK